MTEATKAKRAMIKVENCIFGFGVNWMVLEEVAVEIYSGRYRCLMLVVECIAIKEGLGGGFIDSENVNDLVFSYNSRRVCSADCIRGKAGIRIVW